MSLWFGDKFDVFSNVQSIYDILIRMFFIIRLLCFNCFLIKSFFQFVYCQGPFPMAGSGYVVAFGDSRWGGATFQPVNRQRQVRLFVGLFAVIIFLTSRRRLYLACSDRFTRGVFFYRLNALGLIDAIMPLCHYHHSNRDLVFVVEKGHWIIILCIQIGLTFFRKYMTSIDLLLFPKCKLFVDKQIFSPPSNCIWIILVAPSGAFRCS